MTRLEQAIKLAVAYHEGQLDKAGQEYIFHPLRVMERVRQRIPSSATPLERSDLLIAAVLHDAVEDTPLTLDEIRLSFGDAVADIVDRVTRRWIGNESKEHYTDLIKRAGEDPRSALIKDCDLDDNLDRIEQLPEHEQDIRKRYSRAKIALQGKF
jgi:(p)ppGpp synthase/HD superfamily hydrolase